MVFPFGMAIFSLWIIMKQSLMLWLVIPGLLFSCAQTNTVGKKSENRFSPSLFLLNFYQGPLNHLSAVKQGECPMYPSCSEYSKQCFQKYGFFMGWMMTFDRLMRCGRDEIRLSPEILVDGKWKYYDPVEKNDFWWHHD